MTDDDRTRFSKAMFLMASGYQTAVMNDLRIELYFSALCDLDIATIEKAVTLAVNRCKFCPTVAELREAVEGTQADRAELAWIAWKDAARRHGSYTSLVIHDPALAETILTVFGSWPAACGVELSNEMWSAKRKEFERVYRVMERRELSGPLRLPGLSEIQNTNAEWMHHTPVAEIGATTEPKKLT